MHRNVFPPTPPPELERPEPIQPHKRRSTESLGSQKSGIQASRPAAKPLRLELGAAAFDQKAQAERPRLGTKRSESERPQPRRGFSDSSIRTHESARRSTHHSNTYDHVPEVHIHPDPIEAHSTTAPISISSPPSSYARPSSQHTRSRSGASRCRPRMILSSKSRKARAKVSTRLLHSQPRHRSRTKSSHRISTIPDHGITAQSPAATRLPQCAKSASKCTRRRIRGT